MKPVNIKLKKSKQNTTKIIKKYFQYSLSLTGLTFLMQRRNFRPQFRTSQAHSKQCAGNSQQVSHCVLSATERDFVPSQILQLSGLLKFPLSLICYQSKSRHKVDMIASTLSVIWRLAVWLASIILKRVVGLNAINPTEHHFPLVQPVNSGYHFK